MGMFTGYCELHQILDSAIAVRSAMVLFLECGTNDTFGKLLTFGFVPLNSSMRKRKTSN